MQRLLRFGNDAAGDPGRRGATGLAGNIVDYQRSATSAKNGMIIRAERDIGSHRGYVRGAIRGDDQRKIGNISRRRHSGHGVIVVMPASIEVRTR